MLLNRDRFSYNVKSKSQVFKKMTNVITGELQNNVAVVDVDKKKTKQSGRLKIKNEMLQKKEMNQRDSFLNVGQRNYVWQPWFMGIC